MELITGLVGVVVGAVLSYVLQRRGGRRDRRCDIARQFVELVPRVLSGEAARRRSEYEDRVRRIVDDARLLGSRDLADAADIVSNAFRRKVLLLGRDTGIADQQRIHDFPPGDGGHQRAPALAVTRSDDRRRGLSSRTR